MAGEQFSVCWQEDPFQEKLLGLRIRLPSHHRDAGDTTPYLIFLPNPFDPLGKIPQ